MRNEGDGRARADGGRTGTQRRAPARYTSVNATLKEMVRGVSRPSKRTS